MMDVQQEIKNEYFAAKSSNDAASELLERAKSFYNLMQSNHYLDKLEMMWKAYHGCYTGTDNHQITFTGEQGELVQLSVNHFRNIAQHIYVMITSNRPIMEARAVNTDYKSLSQTYLAQGILEYYMRERHLEDALKKAVELSIVLGAGYVKLEWNATAGEAYDYDEETKQFNYQGDLQFSNLTPFDIVVDGTKESWDHNWVMVRTFKNKYDLMAKYPEKAEKIKSIETKSGRDSFRLAVWSNDTTEDIPVFEFYHKRTESLPEGRYMLFLDSDCVLLDTNLPYRTIPIFRIAPNEILGTTYGYTPMFDIYPIQEGINSIYSGIMSNQNSFLVQSLYVPRGADIAVNSLGEGMNIIEGNAKPEPLQLTNTPEEAFAFLQLLIQSAETISGVNSVARGNPEASLKSGTALALVQSMSLQFMSGLQQSYVKLIEDVGSSVIQILKDFAAAPRVIAIVGKNNRAMLKEFTGDSISSINRVYVDAGNALSRTISGRVQMAEQMLQMKMLKSPEQYFQVLNTGRLESVFEGDMAELLLIKSENEKILAGENPLVSPLDQHSLHIREHKAVIADPELRNDANLVKAALDHIEDHLNALRQTDPVLLQMVGEQPIPPAAPVQPDQPPQGALENSPMGDITNPSPQLTSVQGGALQKTETLPQLPKVPGNLLPNPDAQQAALGNVK